MSEAIPVEIPLVNVNDDTVKLTVWLVKDGDEVREGQNLAEVETSKALVELVASVSGKIHIRVAAGEELAVGTIVAYIGAEAPRASPKSSPSVSASSTRLNEPSPISLLAGTRFSKKALELLDHHRIRHNTFADIGMVREQHVLDYLKNALVVDSSPEQWHFALKGISLDGVSLPVLLAQATAGTVDPAFLDSLQKDPQSFAKLSSADKCRAYRDHGAEIGEDVHIGHGTILIAPRLQLGDRVRLGDNGSLIVRERLTISSLSSFREGLTIRGGTVVFGQNTFAGSRIQIGGGGNADPWAVLIVGDNVYLGDDLFINICRPVVIGREVYLTQRAVLVTHNIGHSILDGYENTFAPIVLEDFSQVGMCSTLYAGSRIGERSIVASNSYVISTIPKGKLAIGVPAHVVRDATRPLTRQKQLQIAETMLSQYHELLQLKGIQVDSLKNDPFFHFTAAHNSKSYALGFLESFDAPPPISKPTDETIFWTFESAKNTPPSGVTVINLLAKTIHGSPGLFVESTREFLRKRGIRLEPGPWRYQKGLL
jgi:acetyltransferase-like isoleucine patch superfamily enzyme